jgi:hypothetical protein
MVSGVIDAAVLIRLNGKLTAVITRRLPERAAARSLQVLWHFSRIHTIFVEITILPQTCRERAGSPLR